jgi:hypothetical protein
MFFLFFASIPGFADNEELKPLDRSPDISGQWYYGIDSNPEFIVRVRQTSTEVHAQWFIRDPVEGSELAYAEARGRFMRFHEILMHGRYLRWFQGTPPGEPFSAHWIIYAGKTRMQEISLSGNNRITSYLVHGFRPWRADPP